MRIYHGSDKILENPVYGSGKDYNDFGLGLYCTESKSKAKQWASSNTKGFITEYDLNVAGLNVVRLNDSRFSTLSFVAFICNYRKIVYESPLAKQISDYIIENFMIDLRDFDVVIGPQCDDCYFTFVSEFINGNISLEKLKILLHYADNQVVLVSPLAFIKTKFTKSEEVDTHSNFLKRVMKNDDVMKEYMKADITSGIYANDVIKEGMRDHDPRLRGK